MHSPKVSVLMSVFNGAKYLRASIESILCQDFYDYEFIIINDGSTDSTPNILEEYKRKDSRIRVIHQENKGLIFSLNRLVSESMAKFLARQDADDVSARSRLRKQYDWLINNSSVSVLGTSNYLINSRGKIENLFLRPTDHDIIAKHLYLLNPICHGSVMVQKNHFDGIGFYNADAVFVEDYELWCRITKHGKKLANLREPLYFWRTHEAGIGWSKGQQQKNSFERIRDEYFSKSDYSDNEIQYHYPGSYLGDKWFEFKGLINAFECHFRGHGIRFSK